MTPNPAGQPGIPEPSSSDESELIRRCLAGDTEAFEPLVERYRQRVWRLAFQLLHDREDAWDCAQEAFVRAFHSLASFRGQSAFYTWLFRITVNVATDRQRARGAHARAFGAERVPEEEWKRTTPDPGGGPDQSAVQSEQRERIRQALDALPPKARTIIMLSDVEGLSYREIAEVLDCPIGTVMSRLHNARKRLKGLLGPMLALLVWIGCLLGSVVTADAQPIIRFGVRVLQASNPTGPEMARPPVGQPPPPPHSGLLTPGATAPPPPPSAHAPREWAPPPPPPPPPGAQHPQQIPAQPTQVGSVDRLVDRLRHQVPLGLVGELLPQRMADLLRTPPLLQAALPHRSQLGIAGQFPDPRPGAPLDGQPVGGERPVLPA